MAFYSNLLGFVAVSAVLLIQAAVFAQPMPPIAPVAPVAPVAAFGPGFGPGGYMGGPGFGPGFPGAPGVVGK